MGRGHSYTAFHYGEGEGQMRTAHAWDDEKLCPVRLWACHTRAGRSLEVSGHPVCCRDTPQLLTPALSARGSSLTRPPKLQMGVNLLEACQSITTTDLFKNSNCIYILAIQNHAQHLAVSHSSLYLCRDAYWCGKTIWNKLVMQYFSCRF